MTAKTPLRWRLGIGAAVVCAFGLLGVQSCNWVGTIRSGAAERTAAYKSRFDSAREVLPRGVRIGYLTDVPTDRVWSDSAAPLRFHGAQNGIAPALLANTADTEWILGNFHQRESLDRVLASNKYVVVHNARNGVVVLRKAPP